MPELPVTTSTRPEAEGESPFKKVKVDKQEVHGSATVEDGPKVWTVPEMLRNLRARKIIRENHGGVISVAAFNPKPGNHNLLATIGHDQVNIYDNEHCGNNLDIMSTFVNKKTDHVEGKELSCGAWINTDHDACIAFAGEEHIVQILSIAHNEVVKLLRGHTGSVTSIASHPTQRALLVTASREERIARFWDLNREECVATLAIDVNSLEFHPSGLSLLVGRVNGAVTEFVIDPEAILNNGPNSDVATMDTTVNGSTVIEYAPSHRLAVDCIRFGGEDGSIRMFTKSRDGHVKVWEGNNVCMQYQFTPAATEYNTLFGVSPDGRYIVGGTEEGDVLIFDTLIDSTLDPVRNKPIATLSHNRCRSPVLAATFSRDLKSVVFTSADAIWRWDFVDPDRPELVQFLKYLEQDKV